MDEIKNMTLDVLGQIFREIQAGISSCAFECVMCV